MISAEVLPLPELLARAGARLRGPGRADCPKCDRYRSVSYNSEKGVYHCHGAGCDFSGGSRSLARQLGLAEQTREQRREAFQRHQKAERAARALYQRVQGRRFELLDEIRALGKLELLAHLAGSDHSATWGALSLVRRLPNLLAELVILENGTSADLAQFLSETAEGQAALIAGVLRDGGIYDSTNRFIELPL